MGFIKIVRLLFYAIALCHVSCAQNLGNLNLYYRLETRLNSLNSSLNQQQKQIDVIIADIIVQQIGHDDDIKALKSQLKTTGDKLAAVEKISKENAELIASNSVQLISVELQNLELASRMDQLNATNQLWRSNFQVVNRTFSELRKKLAIVVPVIPGGKNNFV